MVRLRVVAFLWQVPVPWVATGHKPRDKPLPMGVLVKICGVNSVESADAAVRAGADFVGLVFHTASRRNLSPEYARALAEHLRGRVRLVALVADAGDEQIASVVRAAQPDFLQLHGSETPERIGALRARFGIGILKSIPVAEASDLAVAARYEDVSDMLLFDAKAPKGAARPGGHGAAFDWQLLRGRSFSKPWLLAGGLKPENVARAIASSGAPGVDVSSGVESAPGVKSAELIRAFIESARGAQYVEART
jgi:phosphoribosylanthranilate isomerase